MLKSIELRAGSRGVFKVSVDGKTAYDKAIDGRLPDPGEVSRSLEPRLGARLAWRKPKHC